MTYIIEKLNIYKNLVTLQVFYKFARNTNRLNQNNTKYNERNNFNNSK